GLRFGLIFKFKVDLSPSFIRECCVSHLHVNDGGKNDRPCEGGRRLPDRGNQLPSSASSREESPPGNTVPLGPIRASWGQARNDPLWGNALHQPTSAPEVLRETLDPIFRIAARCG